LQKPKRRFPRWLKVGLGICIVVLVVVGIGMAIVIFRPDVAAQNIDRLRDVLGDAPVAQLESEALSIQDQVKQWEYQLGLIKPAARWSVSYSATAVSQPSPTASLEGKPVAQMPARPNRASNTPTSVPAATPTPLVGTKQQGLVTPNTPASAPTQPATA